MEGMTDHMPGHGADPHGGHPPAPDGRPSDAGPPDPRVPGAGSSGRPGREDATGRPVGSTPPARRPLTRSPHRKIIGGVCTGLGRYFGVDPVIFRVVLTVLALTGGVGLISYGIGWLLIPMDGEEETGARRLLSGRIEGGSMSAVLCALVGSGLFLSTIDNGNTQAFSFCVIGAVVAAIYWLQQRRAALTEAAANAPGVPPAPPAAKPPPTANLSWWRATGGPVSFTKTTGAGTDAGGADRPSGPDYLWGPEDRGAERGPWEAYRRAPSAPRPPRADRPGSVYGMLVLLLAVGAAATGMRAAWHGHPLGRIVESGLVPALGVLGLGLVVGAFLGHRGWGLVTWAVLVTALLAGAAALPRSVGTHWQRVTWRPAAVARVRPLYRLGAGQGILDLSGLALGGHDTATRVDMGAGQLQVRVPDDATVRVEARVGLGDVRFPGAGRHDVDVSANRVRGGVFPPPGGARSTGTITLSLHVGAGQVEVLRGTAS